MNNSNPTYGAGANPLQNGSNKPRHDADRPHRQDQNQPHHRPQHSNPSNPQRPNPPHKPQPQPAPPRPTLEADFLPPASEIIPPEQSPFVDSVTTAEAVRIYEQAGQPRAERTLQRYCAEGILRSHKSFDTNGMTYYLIDRQSIMRHLETLRNSPPSRMPPRAPAFSPTAESSHTTTLANTATTSSKLQMALAQVSSRLNDTIAERDLLKEQLSRKDEQIAALNSQAQASTGTIASLQRMIEALTGYLPKPPQPPHNS